MNLIFTSPRWFKGRKYVYLAECGSSNTSDDEVTAADDHGGQKEMSNKNS